MFYSGTICIKRRNPYAVACVLLVRPQVLLHAHDFVLGSAYAGLASLTPQPYKEPLPKHKQKIRTGFEHGSKGIFNTFFS